jgi:hypothetical protein
LSQKRLALLDEVERKAGGKPARLEAILEALFRPAVEQSVTHACGGKTFMQLFGRCLSEPNAAASDKRASQYRRDFEQLHRQLSGNGRF